MPDRCEYAALGRRCTLPADHDGDHVPERPALDPHREMLDRELPYDDDDLGLR